jgi:hypothetical protein
MLMTVGTKVEVIASTIKKKGAKPRAGSQGYCITSDKLCHINGPNVIAVPASIVFTKFGHQTKRRSELKNVCLIYPKDKRPIKNVKPYLNKLLKNTKDYASINFIMRSLCNKKMISTTDLMIIKPIVTSENIKNSSNEFNSWLRCVLHSTKVRQLFISKYKDERALVSKNFLKGLPFSTDVLIDIIRNKHKFIKLASFLFKHPYNKVLMKNIAGLNQYLLQDAINKAVYQLTVTWKTEQNVINSALTLGNLDRHLTQKEIEKFKVRLSPSALHAYETVWNWLDVLKTL